VGEELRSECCGFSFFAERKMGAFFLYPQRTCTYSTLYDTISTKYFVVVVVCLASSGWGWLSIATPSAARPEGSTP
jgi:hypothetical protein